MTDVNQVVLVGRLTRDAELRYTSTGVAIGKFAIAVNRSVKKKERWTDEASFFDLTLLGKMAESIHPYLTKGTQVAVQGQLRQESWEKDGQKFNKVQVYVNSLQLLGSRGEKDGAKSSADYGSTKGFVEKTPEKVAVSVPDDFQAPHYEDNIPF